ERPAAIGAHRLGRARAVVDEEGAPDATSALFRHHVATVPALLYRAAVDRDDVAARRAGDDVHRRLVLRGAHAVDHRDALGALGLAAARRAARESAARARAVGARGHRVDAARDGDIRVPAFAAAAI